MSASRVGSRARKIQCVTKLRIGDGAAILPPTVNGLHLEFSTRLSGGHKLSRLFWHKYMRRLKYHNPDVPMIVNRTRNEKGPATFSIYLEDLETTTKPQETHSLPSPDANALPQESGETGIALSSSSSSSSSNPAAAESDETGVSSVSEERDPWITIHSDRLGGSPAPEPRIGETRIQVNTKQFNVNDLWTEFMEKSGAQPVKLSEADQARLASIKTGTVRWKHIRAENAKRKEAEDAEKRRLNEAIAEAAALKQV